MFPSPAPLIRVESRLPSHHLALPFSDNSESRTKFLQVLLLEPVDLGHRREETIIRIGQFAKLVGHEAQVIVFIQRADNEQPFGQPSGLRGFMDLQCMYALQRDALILEH